MDTQSLVGLLRDLRSKPSRRVVSIAIAAIASETIFASLVHDDQAQAKGGGKRKGRKKNKKKKLQKPPSCALGEIDCRNDPFDCCAPSLCSNKCGCCPANKPACCGDATSGNFFCYDPAAEACCPTTSAGIAGACPKLTVCSTGAGGTIPICCPSGSTLCAGRCCPPGTFCCEGGGSCCVDISCDPGIGACTVAPLGIPARTG